MECWYDGTDDGTAWAVIRWTTRVPPSVPSCLQCNDQWRKSLTCPVVWQMGYNLSEVSTSGKNFVHEKTSKAQHNDWALVDWWEGVVTVAHCSVNMAGQMRRQWTPACQLNCGLWCPIASNALRRLTGSANMCRFCIALFLIRMNTSVKLLEAIARRNMEIASTRCTRSIATSEQMS